MTSKTDNRCQQNAALTKSHQSHQHITGLRFASFNESTTSTQHYSEAEQYAFKAVNTTTSYSKLAHTVGQESPELHVFTMAEAMLSEDHRASVPDFQEEEKRERPKNRDGKTVVIHAPPKKRRKVSSAASTKELFERISACLRPDDRVEAIALATTSLDHGVEALHDEEITAGLDAVLAKHLGYLLLRHDCKPPEDRRDLSREIADTCSTLEMVYRASVTTILERFNLIGGEVMDVLLKTINDELCNRLSVVEDPIEDDVEAAGKENVSLTDKEVKEEGRPPGEAGSLGGEGNEGNQTSEVITFDRTEEGDTILCKATKTLGHFARVGDATRPMAYHPGLLSTLINLMNAQPHDSVPAEARLYAIFIIANLACHTENMVMMACHPELLTSLIAIASRSVTKSTSAETVIEVLRAQNIAGRALLNLSWAGENRIPMSEMPNLIHVLCKLALFRQPPKRGRTIQELVLQTRQQAVGTLRYLAAAPRRNKIRLCEYENGVLLNILTEAVLNDPDEGVKKRAFATIHNLAVHDTARTMVEHPALVLALKGALLDDNASDLKASAKGTLIVLERSITPDMDCYSNLRELLDAINPEESASEG